MKSVNLKPLIGVALGILLVTASPINADTDSEYMQGKAIFDSGDYQLALAMLTPLAEQGHNKAQLLVGAMYEQGIGTAKDTQSAEHWYKKSALRNNADAQFLLGMLYLNSNSTKATFNAMNWIKQAANNGDTTAQKFINKAKENGWFGIQTA
jgi:hypothetical protein